MKNFWQLLSLIVSLTGFFIVAGISLMNEESLLTLATKSIGVFALLWVIHMVLGAFFGVAAKTSIKTEVAEGGEQ